MLDPQQKELLTLLAIFAFAFEPGNPVVDEAAGPV